MPNEKGRDQGAADFVDLFVRHQRQLHVYIAGLVFNPEDVFDILQDTNLALWKSFDSYEPGTNFLAWARKVAFHRVLRFRERNQHAATAIDPHILEPFAVQASEESAALIDARSVALEDCLQRLKSDDRLLVETRYRPGNTVRALAAQWGRSENALSQSLRRIRGRLRTCLQGKLGELTPVSITPTR